MSLDQDTKIIFVLLDGEMSVSSNKFEDHIFFRNITPLCTKEQPYRLEIRLTLTDFFPIYQNIVKKKEIQDWQQFFDVCQYINEIDLPIQLSKNSELITKWALTVEDLITYEKQNFMLRVYSELDKEVDEKSAFSTLFQSYIDEKINIKINEKTGGKLIPMLKELTINSLLFPLETIERHDITYSHLKSPNKLEYKDIPQFKRELNEEFVNFPWESEYGGSFFMAGGSLLKRLNRNKNAPFYESSDIDFFLITRNECEAKDMIREFDFWIFHRYTDYFITRTKNSVTFVTEFFVFQIILRLYHSKEQVLCGFDIGPCCIGFDGKEVYTIQRGLDSLERRENLVLVWFQSESMSYRCHKYKMRGFNPSFPGMNDEHISTILKQNFKRNTLCRIILNDRKRAKDYDEHDELIIGIGNRSVAWKRRRMSSFIIYSIYKDMQVLSDDIETIFNTEKYQNEFDVIRHVNQDVVHSKITFLKKMCHGQESVSGSFKPTFQNWFEGILF
jgi:hypothetical protein